MLDKMIYHHTEWELWSWSWQTIIFS